MAPQRKLVSITGQEKTASPVAEGDLFDRLPFVTHAQDATFDGAKSFELPLRFHSSLHTPESGFETGRIWNGLELSAA